LDFPEEKWGELVGAAVLSQITEQDRNSLVAAAIRKLLEPESGGGYGNKRTPLQIAFEDAVRAKATQICAEYVEANAKDKIRSVLSDALDRAFDGEKRDLLVRNIADAVVKVLSGDARY
jgi:hypothetical protein